MIHLYKHTWRHRFSIFLSFCLVVTPSISLSAFLSFHLSVFLSHCIQCSKKAQMTRNGFQKPKICIATPKMENGRKFPKFVNIRNWTIQFRKSVLNSIFEESRNKSFTDYVTRMAPAFVHSQSLLRPGTKTMICELWTCGPSSPLLSWELYQSFESWLMWYHFVEFQVLPGPVKWFNGVWLCEISIHFLTWKLFHRCHRSRKHC